MILLILFDFYSANFFPDSLQAGDLGGGFGVDFESGMMLVTGRGRVGGLKTED